MIFVDIILGIAIGFIFGLIPNLHVNVLGYVFLLTSFFTVFHDHFVLFLCIGLSHLITSYIPTALFGIPTESTIMHIFPLLKFFQKGESKTGIFLCLVGSFFGAIFSVVFLPFLFLLFSFFFQIYWFIALAILIVLLLFIFQEKTLRSRAIMFFIICVSGTLGIFTLKYNFFFKDPLIVCVSGLFAFPILIMSLFNKESFVKQSKSVRSFPKRSLFYSFVGSLSALFIILIPSFSSSQAGTIVNKFLKKLKNNEYIVLYSSISISAFIFSIYLAINFFKPRLGYIAILQNSNLLPSAYNFFYDSLIIVVCVCLVVLLIYLFIDKIIDFVNSSNLFILNIIILIVSLAIVLGFAGLKSVPLLLLSISIGFLPIVFNKPKVVLMAYIMFPTLLFYI
ncbi:MAG: tripartite tricarboxylate transporter permease [archaeon]|nr:tripartite tricarboxylate transporter permease [archaeon]